MYFDQCDHVLMATADLPARPQSTRPEVLGEAILASVGPA